MRSWSTSSLEKLKGVHPDLRRVMDRALKEAPFDFRITEGLRSATRQKQLFDIGASTTMNSRHLTGHAVDLVPLVDLDNDGKIETEELYDWPLYRVLAPAIKSAAARENVPIIWGGDWKTFKDGPHWELNRKVYP